MTFRIPKMAKLLLMVVCFGAFGLASACGGGSGSNGSKIECGNNAVLEGGVCQPKPDNFCGEGTELKDGTCVPVKTDPCGPKTKQNDEGKCVVDAPACGPGTQLDPNESQCFLTDKACGKNLAFDSDNSECIPTDKICDSGTKFNSDSGLCLPDSCQQGDVLVNGVCMSESEKLATEADLTESEPNDPNLGGTATAIESVPGQGESLLLTGTVQEPTDFDSDNEKEQDIDSFRFEAETGQWFKFMVQSAGMPDPAFRVVGPNGDYVRKSPIGLQGATARWFVIPESGTYRLEILPTVTLQADEQIGPIGGDDWDYVGSLEQAAPANPSSIDPTSTNLTGDLNKLSDNYFKLAGVDSGQLLELSAKKLGSGGSAVIMLFEESGQFIGTKQVTEDTGPTVVVPSSGNLHALVDWTSITSPDLSFDIGVSKPSDTNNLGTIAPNGSVKTQSIKLEGDQTFRYTFSVSSDQVVEISHTNKKDDDIEINLKRNGGQPVKSAEAINPSNHPENPAYFYHYTDKKATYIMEVAPFATFGSADPLEEFVVKINTKTPKSKGDAAEGDAIEISSDAGLDRARSDFYKINFTEKTTLNGKIKANNGGSLGFSLYAGGFKLLESGTPTGPIEFEQVFIREKGTYLFEVAANEAISSYSGTIDVGEAPLFESEPNNRSEDAGSVSTGDKIAGSIEKGNPDYYKVKLDQPLGDSRIFVADFTPEGEDGVFGCELTNSSGESLAQKSDHEGLCTLVVDGLSAGTYTFRVTSKVKSSQNYTLNFEARPGQIESEPNDASNATGIAQFPTNLYGEANESSSGDIDFWGFQLSQPAALIVEARRLTVENNPFVTLATFTADGDVLSAANADNPVGGGVYQSGKTYALQIGGGSSFFDADFEYLVHIENLNNLGTVEEEPNNKKPDAQSVSFSNGSASILGTTVGAESDLYELSLSSGTYSIALGPIKSIAGPTKIEYTVKNDDEKLVEKASDDKEFELTSSGTVTVEVTKTESEQTGNSYKLDISKK